MSFQASGGFQAALRKWRHPSFHCKVCHKINVRLQTNYRKSAGKSRTTDFAGVRDNLKGPNMPPGQTQLWGAPIWKRGWGPAGCVGQDEVAGKHVSSDASSVCLGFRLPGTTRPQIRCRPAKKQEITGLCGTSQKKEMTITPQAFTCKDWVRRSFPSRWLPVGKGIQRNSRTLQLPDQRATEAHP